MLVLSRKINEDIILRDKGSGEFLGNIRIIDIRGNKVRLGFDAPDNVVIIRSELEKENAKK